MAELLIALIVVAIIIVLKFTGRRCGPKCQSPEISQPKKWLTPKERRKEAQKRKEEIRKRIERQKGKSVKDLNLFSDFIEKGKKEKK